MTKRDLNVDKSAPIVAGKKSPLRPYKKPELAVYGKLADLTAGVGGSKADPGHTSQSRIGGP